MQYFGGKYRIRKPVSAFLNTLIELNGIYLYKEPFCGACWITPHIKCEQRVASDAHTDLILLWNALKAGWVPPDTLSEEEYHQLRHAEPSALRGFAGFACSFGGKWFRGYARSSVTSNHALVGKNSLLRKIAAMQDVTFECRDYRELEGSGALIYCDPPYAGTEKYSVGIDHTEFWDTMRRWSQTNLVVISEYTAPDDFVCVREIPTSTFIRGKNQKAIARVERLFMHKEQADASNF
jgi:DNA adenine methylase